MDEGNYSGGKGKVNVEEKIIKEPLEMTWEDLYRLPVGTILYDKFDGGVRILVQRGPASLCCYVGVPESHPLAGFNYSDLPIRCHGGLTYSRKGEGVYRPGGFWWYGWDYGHGGDYVFYYIDVYPKYFSDFKKWLLKDVLEDIEDSIYDFKTLVSLAEKISRK